MHIPPLAFDLDGTLFDTEEVVRHCYEMAGCKPPPGFWGKPAQEWLSDAVVHSRKHDLYVKHVQHVQPLAPLHMMYRYGGKVLTGASMTSVRLLQSTWHFRPTAVYPCCTLEDKVRILRSDPEPGIYYEDDPDAAVYIAEQVPQWYVMSRSWSRLRG